MKAWNKGLKTGLVPKTAFKKGQKPWNAGLKKSKDKRLSYDRPATFKKGTKPWNTGKEWDEESKKKMSDARRGRFRGENHPGWKGGTDVFRESVRNLYESKKWRSDVFERDNWTCQTCGVRGAALEAHHIKPFYIIRNEYNMKKVEDALGCKELWEITNGVTLCKGCHNLTKGKEVW